jgi:hypothetical protein
MSPAPAAPFPAARAAGGEGSATAFEALEVDGAPPVDLPAANAPAPTMAATITTLGKLNFTSLMRATLARAPAIAGMRH